MGASIGMGALIQWKEGAKSIEANYFPPPTPLISRFLITMNLSHQYSLQY